MSNDAIKQYVVTFHYQEKGLSDLLELASTLTGGGFTTSLKDANGHPHELGSNRFGFISALPAEQVYQLARGLGDKALESLPDVDVEIWPLSHD
ncbi:type V toxin-antitoxin system endoribonuclease antitoxin GhoS [Erwinia tasmaniensis]|uniref:Cytoplasmic protein YdiZ n=1 Tax=Erwinia tasmaniensis (strain DSM 17950 / CFBP 7177 / CIP 109463 / NCPPB 4357 / Et1/99) TaxID=465817 RepID=B2VEJ5_ERWT9|nr:type V toxin-antitoxin system endoribonuclease antitoxin GhoS [Erwinia tasmaniensis]CAO96889.1 Putative cytoplasmic protein YdiZ [Erwinia tasmaniensis Et1/99]